MHKLSTLRVLRSIVLLPLVPLFACGTRDRESERHVTPAVDACVRDEVHPGPTHLNGPPLDYNGSLDYHAIPLEKDMFRANAAGALKYLLRMRVAANKRELDPVIRWLSAQLCPSQFGGGPSPLDKVPIDEIYDLSRIQQASIGAGCGELVMTNGAHVFGRFYQHAASNSPNTPQPDPK